MALTLDSVGSLHEKPLLRFIVWNRKLERVIMKDQVWKTMESNILPGLLATLSHELSLMMQKLPGMYGFFFKEQINYPVTALFMV